MLRRTVSRAGLLLISCGSILAVPLPIAAQEAPRDEGYEGTAEVVAVDAVVDLDSTAAGTVARWVPGGRNAQAPETLEATVDGVAAPVIAVDGARDRLERVVLYFDLALSDDHQLTWSAQRLGDQARELVRRGPVEVIVASERAVTALAPTRDVAALEETLGTLSQLGDPDDELVELRLRSGPAAEPSNRERSLVRSRLDTLLLALVERSTAPTGVEGSEDAGPRRLVFLSTGGYDLAGHVAPTIETSRALAAYGWRVVPLLAPERRGLLPGKRVGKWRGGFWGVFWATREEDRDPEKAEAHLELAHALREQGNPTRAAEEAETAAFHFYGDPRTAEREVAALLLAAEIHGELGDSQRARRRLRQAARIDPEALAGHSVMAAVPSAPAETLEILAEDQRVVRSDLALRQTLELLGDRAVVTVQAPAADAGPDGDGLGYLVLRPAGGGEEIAAGWVRLGEPALVAQARARRGDRR